MAFQYLGENTQYRCYSSFGTLTTTVAGSLDEKPLTKTIATRIPYDLPGESKIEIMQFNRDGDSRFTVLNSIDIPMGQKGPYMDVTPNNLLLAHSVCSNFLRQGKAIDDSRLADIVTGQDLLGEPARSIGSS